MVGLSKETHNHVDVPWWQQTRRQILFFWIGASVGAVLMDVVVGYMANQMHNPAIQSVVTLVIVVIIILAGLVYWRLRYLFAPLDVLYREVKRLATGDFSVRPEPLRGKSDIVRVVEALDDAKGSVRDILQRLQQESGVMLHNADGLRDYARQTSSASEQNVSSVMNLQIGFETQRDLMTATLNSAKNAQDAANEIGHLGGRLQEFSAANQEKAGRAQTDSEEVSRQMQNLEESVRRLAHRVQETVSQMHRGLAVSQRIDEISALTNILALNAAIEAARAGEHGKGFAVVADEVRHLAGEAGQASKEIQEALSAMTHDTEATAEEMNALSGVLDNSAAAVRVAAGTLLAITEIQKKADDAMTAIGVAAKNIRTQAQSVNLHMEALNNECVKQVGAVEAVALASRQQLASMQEVSANAEAMRTAAQGLEVISKRFKR